MLRILLVVFNDNRNGYQLTLIVYACMHGLLCRLAITGARAVYASTIIIV